jgi:hypothetical protein
MLTHEQTEFDSTQHLLPTEVSAKSSFLFGRAQNYPIFSWAWYKYRSLTILSVIAILCLPPLTCLLCAMAIPNKDQIVEIYIASLISQSAIYFLPAAILFFVGPGLATFIYQRDKTAWGRYSLIAFALLSCIILSGWTFAKLKNRYEKPYRDPQTKAQVFRDFQASVTVAYVDANYVFEKDGKPFNPENYDEAIKFLGHTHDTNVWDHASSLAEASDNKSSTEKIELLSKINKISFFIAFTIAATFFSFWVGGFFEFATFLRQRNKLTAYQQAQELRRTQAARAELSCASRYWPPKSNRTSYSTPWPACAPPSSQIKVAPRRLSITWSAICAPRFRKCAAMSAWRQ